MKMMLKNIFLLICLAAFISGGCGSHKDIYKTAEKKDAAYSVIDDWDNKIDFEKPPQRILCASINYQEILFSLVPESSFAAVSKLSADPDYSVTGMKAASVNKYFLTPLSVETVLKYHPDIVIVTDNIDRTVYDTIKEMNIKIFVIKSPKNLQNIKHAVKQLALLVNEKEKGEQIIRKMDEKLALLQHRLQAVPPDKRKTAIELTYNGTFGMLQHLFGMLCSLSSVNNGMDIIPARSSVVVSKEKIVELNPDVLLLPTWDAQGKQDADAYFNEVKNDPAYSNLKFSKMGQVYKFPEKYRYCSSQYVADAAEYLAKLVYPECFQ